MKPALLLIDLQSDFLATANLQPTASTLASRASELLRHCRSRGIPIVHVWTTVTRDAPKRRLPHWQKSDRWMCVAGTPGHEPPASLKPVANEKIIHKTGFNSFGNGELEKFLHASGCDSVILAGLHLHACVRAAAIESLERNLEVYIAEDAVSSNDPIHAAATRRWLAERSVQFGPSSALLFRHDGIQPTKWTHRSPCKTDENLFEVENTSADKISEAAEKAQEAWTHWRKKPLSECQILDTVANRLESEIDELAQQIAIELGKPIRHAQEEIRRAAANVRDVIRRAGILSVPKRESAGLVRHESLGVVAIISAWNNPVAIPLGKIAPALVYGNSVVWKPAPAATGIAEKLMRIFQESRLPVDAVQMVTGDHITAQLIATNPHVNAVTLTGSSIAGQAMQEICARRMVPLQAELSGNNAAIVWDDANLPVAATQVAWGAFAFAGQRCTANRRVIVPAALFEKFMHELEVATVRLPWGDPLKIETEIGPVVSLAKRDELATLVKTAEAEKAVHRTVRPHSGQATRSWVQAGAYAQPVIVGCDEPGHAIVQEETMSPLLIVQRAKDFEHALALCNGVRHGLIASLFSDSAELRKQFLDQAHAGILKFNSSTAGVDVTLPFGGWKASGIGPPEHGDGDFHFYTHPQAVYGA